jgi:hypothetical protein
MPPRRRVGERRRPGLAKVARTRIDREPGYVYFVDQDGDVAQLAIRGSRVGCARKIARTSLEREPGYLYLVDRDGDVARVPLAH